MTFPFVSTGGSSLVTCWGLLAFIKAADTRQNASFAVPLPKRLSIREKRLIRTYEDRRDNEYDDEAPKGGAENDDGYVVIDSFDDWDYEDYD